MLCLVVLNYILVGCPWSLGLGRPRPNSACMMQTLLRDRTLALAGTKRHVDSCPSHGFLLIPTHSFTTWYNCILTVKHLVRKWYHFWQTLLSENRLLSLTGGLLLLERPKFVCILTKQYAFSSPNSTFTVLRKRCYAAYLVGLLPITFSKEAMLYLCFDRSNSMLKPKLP